MQEHVYKISVRDTSNLKQNLTDTSSGTLNSTLPYHTILTDTWASVSQNSSTKLLNNSESSYMHVRKQKDITDEHLLN